MNNMDIKGLLLGSIAAFIGSTVFLIAGIYISIIIFGLGEPGTFSNEELIFSLLFSIPVDLWIGYIIARISTFSKIFNALVFGVISVIFFLFTDNQRPLWYVISSAVIFIPLVWMGATLHVKKANKPLKQDK
jgi:hypothetical protein